MTALGQYIKQQIEQQERQHSKHDAPTPDDYTPSR